MTGGIAVVHQHSERAHAVHALLERVLADAVVDGMDADAGELLHLGDEIRFAIQDDMVAAVRFGDLRFRLARDRTDDVDAEQLRPLTAKEDNEFSKAWSKAANGVG